MIEDFIGVFPNAIPDAACDDIIKTFHEMESSVLSRQDIQDISKMKKDTEVLYLNSFAFNKNYNEAIDVFNKAFWECYKEYTDKYGILNDISRHQFYHDIKVQRTKPSSGYHLWHCEHDGREYGSRLMLVMAYLNDVEEGGETEFLYQSKRVSPRKGTLVICPSGYTHTHRGNPPLSGDKYMINGWIEFTE